MIKNYLTIAFRNLSRNKVFSFINIFGLALGLACSMLILLWVKDELTWDRIHPNIDQLYRVPFGGIFAGIYGLQKPRDGKVTIVLDTKNAPGPYAEKSPFSSHGSPDQA
jgi:hypothetical protein